MSIKYTVLLHSKYSTSSTSIVNIINQHSNTFVENFNIKLLCIDNENVRKRIVDSKKITITSVPCILIIYNDGGVEKYENNDAFVWVNEVIQRVLLIQKQREEEQLQIQKQKQQEEQRQQQMYIEEQKIYEEEEHDEEEEDAPPTPPPPRKIKTKPKPKQVQKVPVNKTSIEDLEEIDEQFDFVGNNIEQVESTNALSVKRNDLLSMAAEMQKSRDNFVEKGEKPKFPLNR